MIKSLVAAAIIAGSLFALPGTASAASLPDAAAVGAAAQTQTQRVDFRPFRHCHGPRWDRRCHGGVLFFRDRDRDRRHWRHYRGRDRYDRYERRRYRRDDY